jgi:hypothetical protein
MPKIEAAARLLLAVSALLAASALFYRYVFYIPQVRENISRQYDKCILTTQLARDANWRNNCEAIGQPPSCQLPADTAARLRELFADDNKECLSSAKLYSEAQ